MNKQDVMLIRLKMKEKGMTYNSLAKKVHTTVGKLCRIMDGYETSKIIEERLIKWLEK